MSKFFVLIALCLSVIAAVGNARPSEADLTVACEGTDIQVCIDLGIVVLVNNITPPAGLPGLTEGSLMGNGVATRTPGPPPPEGLPRITPPRPPGSGIKK